MVLDPVQSKPSIPPLPVFQEGKDDIDSYLCRFERHASCVGWNKPDWALALSALLSGKALDIISRLTAELKGYDLTEEGYRMKFRQSKLHQGETLKKKLEKEPILHLPDLTLPFILRTDASDVGIGAILLQERDGKKFPMAYASRKLLSTGTSVLTHGTRVLGNHLGNPEI